MTDRQTKIEMLNNKTLTGKPKADFCYRASRSLIKELKNLKELSDLLNVIPDSYLEKIDFKEAATFAMELTEILITKCDPAHIALVEELLDGSQRIEAKRFYHVKLGNSLPGIKNATIELGITYKPTKEEIRFNRRLYDHKNSVMPVIVDNKEYSFDDFTKRIAPSIRAKDPNLKINNRGIMGYKPPEEFEPLDKPKPVDPKLLDVIRRVTKELDTDMRAPLTVIPDYPKVEDENVELFFKGLATDDFSEISKKLIADERELQKKRQGAEGKEDPK